MSQKRAKELRKASKELAIEQGKPKEWKRVYKDLKALTKNKFLNQKPNF